MQRPKPLTTLLQTMKAARNMDWQQVVLNGGPPCFHLDADGSFCGRAERWFGHEVDDEVGHDYVSLEALLKETYERP